MAIEKSAEQKKTTGKKVIYIYDLKNWLRLQTVKSMLKSSSRERGTVYYSLNTAKDFTASAPGTDLKHHILNSYLVGYMPFRTNSIWTPWLTLAQKKTYQTDRIVYKGRNDVWQTSRQAYKLTRGDCEDHALLLADWLISLGQDARVVIGTHNGGGHAWVVLFRKGKEYLLEATQKSGIKKMGTLPLASLQKGYRPMYMFNRRHFWKNTGSSLTTRYRSSKWKKMSKYSL